MFRDKRSIVVHSNHFHDSASISHAHVHAYGVHGRCRLTRARPMCFAPHAMLCAFPINGRGLEARATAHAAATSISQFVQQAHCTRIRPTIVYIYTQFGLTVSDEFELNYYNSDSELYRSLNTDCHSATAAWQRGQCL
jgi:hypothetical protein